MVELSTVRAFAKVAHKGQLDKQDVDYMAHVERVVGMVPPSCKVIALCHDLLEDTWVTVSDLQRLGLTTDDVFTIQLLTRRLDETYSGYITRIETSRNHRAIRVKIADLVDNLRAGPPELAAKYHPRYHDALRRLLQVYDTPPE